MNNLEFSFNGEMIAASYERAGDAIDVTVGDKHFLFQPSGENLYTVMINGATHHAAVVKHKGTYYIDLDSMLLEVREPSEDGFAGGAGGQAGEKDKIFAPMPGKIVKIMVQIGDKVEEKQPMVIVEAMKMENQVNSKAKGTVKAVNFAAGDQVDIETPIIELELEA